MPGVCVRNNTNNFVAAPRPGRIRVWLALERALKKFKIKTG